MLLTTRETQLLTELLNSPTTVSLDQMMSILKVSKRTLYRELANLETTLNTVDASLVKVGRGHYKLTATTEAIGKLQSMVLTETSPELPTKARQHAILLTLLTATEPTSIHHFLESFQISNTTFFSDIKQLEDNLNHLPLTIVRKNGYEIEGPERHRRLLIANTLVMEINEYQFFHLVESEQDHHYFLHFVKRDHLLFAQTVTREVIEPRFGELSDRKLAFIILMLTLSIDRVSQNRPLADEKYSSQVNKEFLEIAKQVFATVAKETKRLYPVNEIVFFASMLSDFANSFDSDFFDDNFNSDLAYKVKKVISLVSQTTEVNFFEDLTLFKMLLTHISGVLTRAILEDETLNNPILEKITVQYSDITKAIKIALVAVFHDQQFSEEEVAYMVLHFANSFEKNAKPVNVNIAGISPSGIASTSMLEMQLHKHFPFINEIKFFRVGDIKRLNVDQHYDLVISTALLPGYNGNYILVSPLLVDDEVQQLKDAFRDISLKKRAPQQALVPISKRESYEEVVAFISETNQLLDHFSVEIINNLPELKQTLDGIVQRLPNAIITDWSTVSQKLLDRYLQAPIGIPNTNFALFHAASSQIKEPLFRIYDLKTPLTILAMDKQEIVMKRLLLMLGPSPMPPKTSQILGKISGSIIMNDLNIEIFNSGNKKIIYHLLSSLLIEEVTK